MSHHSPTVSFVVPVYNEQACLQELYRRILSTMETLGETFEIIFVDDCSKDNTLPLLRDLSSKDSRIKVLSFSRNFGHQIAVTAGLHHASGQGVIVMDGDLQDPPELTGELLKKWREGFQVIYCVRRTRRESLMLQLAYKSFYRLLQLVSPLPIPLDTGDFCFMDKRVVDEMRRLSEERPFVRGLRTWVGFSQTALEYDRPSREAGETKYTFWRLCRLAMDGLISFSNVPLRVSSILGLFLSFFSLLYSIYIFTARTLMWMGIISQKDLIRGWATLVVSILFLFGIQFIFLGIIGEYIGRIFMETKERPLFVLKEKIGFVPS